MRCVLFALASVLIPSSCNSETGHGAGWSAADEPTVTPAADFDARYRAADDIRSSEKRNDALAALAESAAESGNAEIAIKAVDGIRSTEVGNVAAKNSSIKLAEQGQTEAASKLAEKISNSSVENEARAAIATIAAAMGDVDTVKRQIDSINFVNLANSAARQSAVKLAQAGKEAGALEVANKITDSSIRDDALQLIAAGGEPAEDSEH